MAWDAGLVGVQLAIAGYPNSPLRVLAGPGTGKTSAMMRRVARLLEAGIPPHEILTVTFTRTAAHDLVSKLTTLGVPGANQVAAKTLHSLSFSVLGRAAVFQATQRTPRPLLDCELKMMVNDLKDQFGGKREVRRLIRAFEAYWATLQHHTPGWPTKKSAFVYRVILADEKKPNQPIHGKDLRPYYQHGFWRMLTLPVIRTNQDSIQMP